MPTSISTPRPRGRIATSLALVLGLLAAMVAFAPSAFAHHPEVSVQGSCDTTTGQWNISWTANSWSTGNSGTHTNIRVDHRLRTGSSTWTSWTEVPSGSPGVLNVGNGYTFNGSFTAPSSHNRVEVRVTAVGQWGAAGNKISGTGGESRTAGRDLTGKCETPPEPEVGSLAITKTVVGTVDATGAPLPSPLTFSVTVTGPDSYSNTFGIVHDQTVTLDGLAPGHYTVVENDPTPAPASISITADGAVTVEDGKTAAVAIINTYYGGPDVTSSLDWTCAAGISGTLTNNGDVAATFAVTYTVGGEELAPISVVVGANASEALTPPAGATAVTVTSGDHTDSTSYDPDDCYEAGVPSFELVCSVDGSKVVVTLVDDGTLPTDYTIEVTGDVVDSIARTGSFTVEIPVDEGDVIGVSVSAGGQTVGSESFTVDCLQPGTPSFELVCSVDGSKVVVTLTDDGTVDSTYTVLVDGQVHSTETGSFSVEIPVDEGDTVVVSVETGGQAIGSQSFTVDCYANGVDYSRDCSGYEITLTNPGQLPLTYTVTVVIDGEGQPTEHTVAPGGDPVVISGTVEEGSTASVEVVEPVTGFSMTDEWTQRCAPPPPPPPGGDPDPDPRFTVDSATAVCPAAPYLDFTVGGDGTGPVTITFLNPNGDDVVRSGLGSSGRILFPGAVVGTDGTVTGWPGWVQGDDGTWSRGGDYQWVLDGVTVRFEQDGRSAVRTIAYPVLDPTDCGPDDSDVGGGGTEVGGIEEDNPAGTGSTALPRTGGNQLVTGLVAFTLAIIGTALVAVERRGFQVVGRRHR